MIAPSPNTKPSHPVTDRADTTHANAETNVNAQASVSADTKRVWLRRPVRVLGMMICIVFGLGFVGLEMRPKAQADTDSSDRPIHQPLLVETLSVHPVHSFEIERHYTGTIVARRVSDLSFERSGRLESLSVDQGNRVEMGQTLAVLNSDDLRAKRRETLALREHAVARLQELHAGPRQEVIQAAKANVERLRAEVRLLQAQKQRSKTLRADRAVSQDELDRHSFGLEANQAALQQGLAQLEELVNGTRQEQVDAQQATVEQLDAVIEQIDVDLRKSELNAPFAGTISRRYADEGKVAQPSETIFTLVEDQSLEAWIGIPASASEQLIIETQHTVTIDGRNYRVQVAGHRPEVDPVTRTRTVILSLASDATHQVVHGQIVRLQLNQSIEASGFWLPMSALRQGERGLWSCFVTAPQESTSVHEIGPERYRVEQRELEVLYTDSDRVLVRGTLSPGENVISSGLHRVSSGQIVRAVASTIQ